MNRDPLLNYRRQRRFPHRQSEVRRCLFSAHRVRADRRKRRRSCVHRKSCGRNSAKGASQNDAPLFLGMGVVNCAPHTDGFRVFHGDDVHTFPFFAAQDSEENIGIFCFLCFYVSRLDKSPTLVYI